MASNKQMNKRMIATFGIVMVILLGLALRTGYLQIVRGEELQKGALEQQTQDRQISAKRGAILDRNGKTLAVSASVEQVSVSPNVIKEQGNADEVVAALSDILDLDPEDVREKVTAESYYISIARRVEKETADRIREKNLKGVNLDADTKRYYPYGAFASHVIGFTGNDNQGLDGLEKQYDSVLSGTPGRVVSASNAKGTDVPYKFEQYIDPIDGQNLVLTIDETIQHFVEKYLEKAYIENDLGAGAAAIVMNPQTAEIYAMCSLPDFDLNQPRTLTEEAEAELEEKLEEEGIEKDDLSDTELSERETEMLFKMWRNKAVTDSYEPGSTFKLATGAAALEQDVCKLDDIFDCGGSYQVADKTINCHHTAGHGPQTFVKAICNSCNPALMQIAERIGNNDFFRFVEAFGFRDLTGIDLPGEANGVFFTAENFNEVQLATTSFGQGLQVTPLQVASFVSAICNGGTLYKPHLVKQMTDQEGNVIKTVEPEPIRQIMSSETAATMRNIMEQVVLDGAASNAYIKGYRVGAKTGTSEKLPRGNEKYIASCVGMAPVDNPQVVVLVILDEPVGVYYGGTIAAPVVRSILEDTLQYMGLEPQYTEEETAEETVNVPNVVDMSVNEAANTLTAAGLNYQIMGDGETVLSQIPVGSVAMEVNSTIILYTQEQDESETVEVPDVTGLTPAEARQRLSEYGLNCRFTDVAPNQENSVTAYSQTPAAGEEVAGGSTVLVEFRALMSEF